MEEKKNEGKKENKKDIRCTQFEYSSSESDSDDENIKMKNKLNLQYLSKKIFKSTKNLVKGEKKEKKKKKNKSKIYLSRYVRMLLFFLLLIFSVIIDLDSGIIVSSYKSFTQDLNMSDLQYGSLNSITTIGKIIALLIFMVIINKNHRKFIIVTTSFFHGIYFFGFFLNDNYYYIAALKFFASFCKVFITVYIPVWIDQFGIKKYKTLLLTIVFMVTSYGRIVGAWIGTVIFDNEWKKAFSCCGVIFLVLSVGLFIIPQKYYSTKYMLVEQQKKYSGNIVEKLVPTKNDENEIKKEIENIKDIEYLDDEKKNEKIMEETEKDTDVNSNEKKEKLIYDYKTEEENKYFKNLSTFNKFKIVILNQCFIFSSLSRACLFFLFKIIHVFLKKYTFEALNYNNEITFFYYYSLTTILAPSLGSLIGGAICNKFLGGYESKKSVYIILFFGTIAVFFITLARISTNFNYLIIYIFGYFFSVSAFLPTISGYIINSLHKELKGFGSSFDSLITNILGKLPSPIIYGIINDRHKKEEPKYAWNKSLMVYYLGTVFIYLACFFKWKLNDKNKSKKKIKGKSNDVVEQTMKDYTLNRSSLVRAEKPVPKYDNNNNNNVYDSSPVELDYVDDSATTNENNRINIKKKLLVQLNQIEEKK